MIATITWYNQRWLHDNYTSGMTICLFKKRKNHINKLQSSLTTPYFRDTIRYVRLNLAFLRAGCMALIELFTGDGILDVDLCQARGMAQKMSGHLRTDIAVRAGALLHR